MQVLNCLVACNTKGDVAVSAFGQAQLMWLPGIAAATRPGGQHGGVGGSGGDEGTQEHTAVQVRSRSLLPALTHSQISINRILSGFMFHHPDASPARRTHGRCTSAEPDAVAYELPCLACAHPRSLLHHTALPQAQAHMTRDLRYLLTTSHSVPTSDSSQQQPSARGESSSASTGNHRLHCFDLPSIDQQTLMTTLCACANVEH
jgi:hypothetical protein